MIKIFSNISSFFSKRHLHYREIKRNRIERHDIRKQTEKILFSKDNQSRNLLEKWEFKREICQFYFRRWSVLFWWKKFWIFDEWKRHFSNWNKSQNIRFFRLSWNRWLKKRIFDFFRELQKIRNKIISFIIQRHQFFFRILIDISKRQHHSRNYFNNVN